MDYAKDLELKLIQTRMDKLNKELRDLEYKANILKHCIWKREYDIEVGDTIQNDTGMFYLVKGLVKYPHLESLSVWGNMILTHGNISEDLVLIHTWTRFNEYTRI